jgi:hypothetical protein
MRHKYGARLDIQIVIPPTDVRLNPERYQQDRPAAKPTGNVVELETPVARPPSQPPIQISCLSPYPAHHAPFRSTL